MKLLSSLDELLLLVIQSLARNAYGVTIRQKLSLATGKNWSIGSIYDPLYRLEERGLIRSEVSDPVSERGGRSKRLFYITEEGVEALNEHQKIRAELNDQSEGFVYNVAK